MSIKLGNTAINKTYLGSIEIKKAYLGNTLIFDKTSNSNFDTDYQAVLDYATTNGFALPTSGNQTLGNALVVALKANAIWSLLDQFYVHAKAGDNNFALINWKNPAASAVRVNTPTWSATDGYLGSSTSYISGSVANGSGNWSINSASIFAWFPTLIASGTQDILSSTGYARLWYRNSGPAWRTFLNDNTNIADVNSTPAGLHMVCRTASNSFTHFTNGSDVGSYTRNTMTLDTGTMQWARLNPIAVFGTGANLASVQGALYTAISNFING